MQGNRLSPGCSCPHLQCPAGRRNLWLLLCWAARCLGVSFTIGAERSFWGPTSQSILPPHSALSRPRGFWISRKVEFTLSPPSCIPWHKIKVSVVSLLVRDSGYRKLLEKGLHINSLAWADRILLGRGETRGLAAAKQAPSKGDRAAL